MSEIRLKKQADADTDTPPSGYVAIYKDLSAGDLKFKDDVGSIFSFSAGVTDHGALTGLGDDDHTQYHNNTRGDARYFTQAQSTTNFEPKNSNIQSHISNTSNPHAVTAVQVGAEPALGFTPENVVNKATTFATLNDTLYPTVQAVFDRVLFSQDDGGSMFFTNVASDLGGGRLEMTKSLPGGGGFGIPVTGVTDGQYIADFCSVAGVPNAEYLPAGAFSFRVQARQDAGTQVAKIYAEFYTRTILGVDTLIGTSTVSEALTGVNQEAYGVFVAPITRNIGLTDRILIRFKVEVTGVGTAPDITLDIQGLNSSRMYAPFSKLETVPTPPPPTGTANQVAYFNASGDLDEAPGFSSDPSNFNGYTIGLDTVPASGTAFKKFHQYYVNHNPTVTDSQENWHSIWLQTNVGSDDSGNQLGDNTNGGFNAFGINIGSTNKSNVGYAGFLDLSSQFGNGTDPITVERLQVINQYFNVASGVTLNQIQGIGLNYNGNAGSTIEQIRGYTLGLNIDDLSTNGYGFQLFGSANFTGAGNDFKGVDINPTITGTLDSYTAIYGSSANVTATNKWAGYFQGDVVITGSLTFGGALSIGQLNAFYGVNPVDGAGNPQTVHSLVSSMTALNGVTTANVDAIGVNTAMLITLEANSINTSGAFGLGFTALALPCVVETHTGSSLDFMSGTTAAINLAGTSTGGTIDTVKVSRSVVVPNGITTVNNVRGFEFDAPFGDVGTVMHAFYCDVANAENYFYKGLVVGELTEVLANSSTGLEISSSTKAFLNARMTTAQRNALTAINGMQIYNSDTDKLQVYAAGSWVDLH